MQRAWSPIGIREVLLKNRVVRCSMRSEFRLNESETTLGSKAHSTTKGRPAQDLFLVAKIMSAEYTVLFVDDEPDKRNLLAFALQREGYEVHTAPDGEAGLRAVEEHQP